MQSKQATELSIGRQRGGGSGGGASFLSEAAPPLCRQFIKLIDFGGRFRKRPIVLQANWFHCRRHSWSLFGATNRQYDATER